MVIASARSGRVTSTVATMAVGAIGSEADAIGRPGRARPAATLSRARRHRAESRADRICRGGERSRSGTGWRKATAAARPVVLERGDLLRAACCSWRPVVALGKAVWKKA